MVKLSDPNMFSDFQTEGIWSFSENMDKNYSGILYYNSSEGKFNLTLYSSEEFDILNYGSFYLNNSDKQFSLFGFSSKQEFIHLVNSRVIRSSSSSIFKIVISCSYAIFGPNFFKNNSQKNISKVHFSFLGLNEWLDLPIWNYNRQQGKITLNKPHFKKYRLSNIRAILKENYSRTDSSNSKKLKSNSEMFYTLEFDSPQTLEYVETKTYIIVQLFYFLFSLNLPIKFVVFEHEVANIPISQSKVIEVPNKYRVYHQQISQLSAKPFNCDKNIKYSVVSPVLEPILNTWIKNYGKLKSIVQTFVGDLQIDSFVETKFLNSCRNLEVLHRVLYSSDSVLPDDIEVARIELLGIIKKYSPNIEKYFENRINFYEGKTLGNRIKELILKLPPDFSKKIISFENKSPSKSRSRFVSAVTQTRNYITHGNTDKTEYPLAFTNIDLFIASKILNLITEYFILKYIGIEQKIIIEDLSSNERYWIVFNNKLGSESQL